ncbi:M23 family metallopeptidase [Patescibacteria group bacterium]|nr:M23 family metallopeptidase [Patescibacteria group bacterium]
MQNLTIRLGREQLVISLKSRPGRPKNTPWKKVRSFGGYLHQVWNDNRFHGNKFSRVLRRIFEVRRIKQLIGLNLAIVGLATSASLPLNITAQIETPHPESVELNLQTERTVQSPVQPVVITQRFHQFHPGLDFKGVTGTPVKPVMNGVVEIAQHSSYGYGKYVVVDHQNGYESLYAHLNEIYTQVGDLVNHQTTIGTIGNTGWSTGPHLHLEIWEFKRPVNPLSVIQ